MADERDDRKTQAYIDDAFGRFLRIQDKVERSQYAWAYLRGMRRMGDDDLCRQLKIHVQPVATAPTDLNLADAEHYMDARFLAGSTGDPATKSLVYGYELVKVVRYVSGREKDLRTDPAFLCFLRRPTRSPGAHPEQMTASRITAPRTAAKPAK
jgi:hypothetical protein